jgi:hypothetical protein
MKSARKIHITKNYLKKKSMRLNKNRKSMNRKRKSMRLNKNRKSMNRKSTTRKSMKRKSMNRKRKYMRGGSGDNDDGLEPDTQSIEKNEKEEREE